MTTLKWLFGLGIFEDVHVLDVFAFGAPIELQVPAVPDFAPCVVTVVDLQMVARFAEGKVADDLGFEEIGEFRQKKAEHKKEEGNEEIQTEDHRDMKICDAVCNFVHLSCSCADYWRPL